MTTQSGVPATIKVVTEYIYPSDYNIEPGQAPVYNQGILDDPGHAAGGDAGRVRDARSGRDPRSDR